MIGIVMFFAALAMLLIGFPVAFTFGAVSVFFGLAAGILEAMQDGIPLMEGLVDTGIGMFAFMPFRIYAIMHGNYFTKNWSCRETS